MAFSASSNAISPDLLRKIFGKIGELCATRGSTLEIAIYGGSALVMDFSHRNVTGDIDYCVRTDCRDDFHEIAYEALAALGRTDLYEAFRDDVSIFESDDAEYLFHGDYGEPGGTGGLRVFKASPRYILSMKVLSMRGASVSNDPLDVWALCEACNIRSVDEAEDLVSKFYPGQSMRKKSRLILEDLLAHQQAGKSFSRSIAW